MEDRCVSCGAIIPEGRQVCESCERGDRKFTDEKKACTIRGDTIKNGHKIRLYKVYKSMIERCYYKKSDAYKHYGGKGISVCDEWLNSYHSFENWALENGYDANAPRHQCTLDRIDGNKNYCPENCRWVSMKEQLNNTSQNVWITANGLTLNIQQWADKLGVLHSTLQTRKRMGWSDERIINTPIRKYEMRNRKSGR